MFQSASYLSCTFFVFSILHVCFLTLITRVFLHLFFEIPVFESLKLTNQNKVSHS